MRLGELVLSKIACVFLVYVSFKEDNIVQKHKFIRYSLTLIGFTLYLFCYIHTDIYIYFFKSPFSFAPKVPLSRWPERVKHCHRLDENGYLPASILKQAAAHKTGSEPTVIFTGHNKGKRNSPIKRQLQGYQKKLPFFFYSAYRINTLRKIVLIALRTPWITN